LIGSVVEREPFGCPVCCLSLDPPGRCRNEWCRRRDRSFSVVHAMGRYSGALRRAVARYKYRRELWWADVFATMIGRFLCRHETWFEEFHVLTPVPAYTGPGARRRWDHMGEVARRLDVVLAGSWQVWPGLISKRSETPPLQGRSGADRRRLAEGPLRRSLQVREDAELRGARVLVIDDVLTEGSTLNAVARSLTQAGAVEVAGLVIARPEWTLPPFALRCPGSVATRSTPGRIF
jgi:predicted amidophosphoribosyltransferase